MARTAIYGNPASPYRQLLASAGCEYGDLARMVGERGVEGALHVLLRHGVYLTVNEFKGRRPVVRGETTIAVDPSRLRNPASAVHLWSQTSGSRGARTPVPIDLRFVEDATVNVLLALDARGALDWRLGFWDVPGGTLRPLLANTKAGAPVRRWFSPVDPAAPDLHARYRWSARLIRMAGQLAGLPIPPAEHVPTHDPLPIARWMAEVLRAGDVPLLHTYTSPAVRVCRAAGAAGLDLRGAQFTVYGEPVTRARLAEIRRVGAYAQPRYATVDAFRVGEGCLAPDAPDDVHLQDDLHALVQPGPGGQIPECGANTLFLSSLRPTVSLILLNVSLGDQAVMVDRRCGCPLERFGWKTHLHTVRSFEKLTAGGMTFLDTDVIRVLEEVLPARFGGAPTDYQLVEEETAGGLPGLRLLMRPELGPADPAAVAETFLAAIGAGAGAERIMGQVWRDGQLLRVERRAPLTTASGKILHLHVGGGQ